MTHHELNPGGQEITPTTEPVVLRSEFVDILKQEGGAL